MRAFRMFFAVIALLGTTLMGADKTIYDFTLNSIDGQATPLSTFKGKVILLVNVASKCGYTPQYEGMESVYGKYKAKGFEVLAFPANEFGAQEPGSNGEIKSFCSSKYNVTFPLMAKVEVNGDGACDLYKYLKALDAKPKGPGEVKWNFEKFLVARDGKVVNRFASDVTPDDPKLRNAIEEEIHRVF